MQREGSLVFWGHQTQRVTLTSCLPLRPHLWIGAKPVSCQSFLWEFEESGVCAEALSHKPFSVV